MLLSVRNMTVPQVIAILRDKELLKREMKCSCCGDLMVERERKNNIDGVSWVCYSKECPKKKTTIIIRNGSLISDFCLSLADVWTLVFMLTESVQVCDAVCQIDESLFCHK